MDRDQTRKRILKDSGVKDSQLDLIARLYELEEDGVQVRNSKNYGYDLNHPACNVFMILSCNWGFESIEDVQTYIRDELPMKYDRIGKEFSQDYFFEKDGVCGIFYWTGFV